MSHLAKWQIVFAVLVNIALLPLASPPAQADLVSSESAQVERVVDGDTVKVILDATTETVRVIGIDTPETVHPSKPVECFGMEASSQLKELLDGQVIILQANPAEDRELSAGVHESGWARW